MVAIHDSGSKNQSNFKQIIQILQPIVIGYFSPHLYITIFSIWVDATLFVVLNNFLLIDAIDRSKISSVLGKPIPPFNFRKHSL